MKKFKVECLDQSTFVLIRTEVLKARLKHLKKKPKKNEYGINRIQNELESREFGEQLEGIEEAFDSISSDSETINENEEELEKHKHNMDISGIWECCEPKQPEQSGVNTVVKARINEMKSSLARTVREEDDFIDKIRIFSNKIKVIAEVKYKDTEKIYGYIIQNISTDVLELNYSETELEILCPGDLTIIGLCNFIIFTCQPEFGFTLSNGYIKQTVPIEEMVRQEEETGQKPILSNYHFVLKDSEEEELTIIYIE